MESELLSLKWNNHRTTFLHVIGTLRSKASYTDATLACDGKFYPVHKLVLSTCSEYFGAIFERTPCKSPVIVLKDIECKNLEFLLDYMYIGEVNVRQNELAALIKAAECLKIKGLAVPDEEPSVNTFPKNIRSDSQRESSPPAKRRRNVQSGSELEGKRESSETSNNTGLEKGPSKDLGECPLDDGISPIKLEPLDDAEVSNFITNSNSTGVNNEKISDEGGGGCESSKEDATTDIKEFFNAKVESEESVHMGEYSSSEFAGPSGVQNSNLSQWDSENSFPMDHLLAGSSSTQLETQQQQQQLIANTQPFKMSGARPVPYTLPKRKRPGRMKFFNLGTPAITKYNIVDDLKLGFYLGTSEGLRNQDAIISSLLYLIDPAVMTRDLFMNKDITGNVNMFNPPLVATKTTSEAEDKLNKYIIGFAIVCHLGKPITQDNKTYVHKRLKAIGYACEDVNLSELRESKVVNMIDLSVFDEIKSNLANAKAVSPLLVDALKMSTDTALRKATLDSFKMVFEGYGMTATKHMAYFYTIVTKALLFEVVLKECEEFKIKYEAFIAKYPDNWKLGRLLGLPGVSDLDNSKYPHLYTCAIARASGPNGRGLGKYKKSKFQLKEDERTLTEAAMTNLTGKTVVTQGSGSSTK